MEVSFVGFNGDGREVFVTDRGTHLVNISDNKNKVVLSDKSREKHPSFILNEDSFKIVKSL